MFSDRFTDYFDRLSILDSNAVEIDKTISDLTAMVAPTGRPVRQRTTVYGVVPQDRMAAAAASDGVCDAIRRRLPIAVR